MGLPPFHYRIVTLLDKVKDLFHYGVMDNLYDLEEFSWVSFAVHKNNVLAHGVTRTGMGGLSACVLQENGKIKKDDMKARVCVKAFVLEKDDDFPKLLALSVYDTNLVHLLSMMSESIHWANKQKNSFNVDANKFAHMDFLQLLNINYYNKVVGGFNLSDQLQNQYDVDAWVHNFK